MMRRVPVSKDKALPTLRVDLRPPSLLVLLGRLLFALWISSGLLVSIWISRVVLALRGRRRKFRAPLHGTRGRRL